MGVECRTKIVIKNTNIGEKIMKKILLILAIVFFCVGSSASAEVTGTGKVVEIKDQLTKTFMYQILLNPYISHNTRQFYHEKYQIEKSMEWEGPELEKIRIWIQKQSQLQVRQVILTL